MCTHKFLVKEATHQVSNMCHLKFKNFIQLSIFTQQRLLQLYRPRSVPLIFLIRSSAWNNLSEMAYYGLFPNIDAPLKSDSNENTATLITFGSFWKSKQICVHATNVAMITKLAYCVVSTMLTLFSTTFKIIYLS